MSLQFNLPFRGVKEKTALIIGSALIISELFNGAAPVMAETAEVTSTYENNVYDIDLSEASTAYFTFNNTPTDPLGGTAGDWNGFIDTSKNGFRIGGSVEYARNVMMGWVGPANEALAKYSDAATIMKNGLPESSAYEDDLHMTGNYKADIRNNRDMVKRLIMEKGAVSTSYYHSTSSLYKNTANNCYYNYRNTTTNHAITIIGWDDDFPKENFSKESEGNGAWIVRNTHGAGADYKWTYNGYFYLSYYDTSIMDTAFAFDFDRADNFDNCHQYDGGMITRKSMASSEGNILTTANVFTAKSGGYGEYIRGVAFETSEADENYTVRVYKGVTTDPGDGTLCEEASVSGKTSLAGYYSTELAQPVYVAPGEKFAIAVSLQKNNAKSRMCYESEGGATWQNYKSTVSSDAGQGFYKNKDKWYDFSERVTDTETVDGTSAAIKHGNYRIKAYTDDADEVSVDGEADVVTGGRVYELHGIEEVSEDGPAVWDEAEPFFEGEAGYIEAQGEAKAPVSYRMDVPGSFDGLETEPVTGAADEIPHYFITKNLPPLRSQGGYETCWAHSLIACAEIFALNHEELKDGYELKDSYSYEVTRTIAKSDEETSVSDDTVSDDNISDNTVSDDKTPGGEETPKPEQPGEDDNDDKDDKGKETGAGEVTVSTPYVPYSAREKKQGMDGEEYTIDISLDDSTYDGKKKRPDITVYDSENNMLSEGSDYRIAFKNNKNADTHFDEKKGSFVENESGKHPTYIIKFRGSYKGASKITGTFNINPYPLSFAMLSPKSDVIRVRSGSSFRFLKRATANLSGREKKLNIVRDIDSLTLRMVCISEGSMQGREFTMADNAGAPAGEYKIVAYGRGNFYHYKEDGYFRLVRK